MSRTLVLNASFEPLTVVDVGRAVVLVLTEKATVVEHGDGVLRSPSTTLRVPSVIRLTRYVRIPFRAGVPVTNHGVLARDNHRCVYCRKARATTVDHVVPRSRGGAARSWENQRAACQRCNHRKGDRLLSELGWPEPEPVAAPTSRAWLIVSVVSLDAAWTPYLSAWTSDIDLRVTA
ncbi:MAG TPA: HNH endonuclease [Candidatus Nanopelagicales bacterium]